MYFAAGCSNRFWIHYFEFNSYFKSQWFPFSHIAQSNYFIYAQVSFNAAFRRKTDRWVAWSTLPLGKSEEFGNWKRQYVQYFKKLFGTKLMQLYVNGVWGTCSWKCSYQGLEQWQLNWLAPGKKIEIEILIEIKVWYQWFCTRRHIFKFRVFNISHPLI